MSTQLINQVLELTNVERAKAGLKPLTLNNQLSQAAQGHSDSMAADDFFSHTGVDGSNVGDRVQDAGYKYSYTGENIAAGQKTAAEVVQSWMDSPGHRANILNADYTEMGIGYELLENDLGSVNYHHYWTQVFGAPQGNSNQSNPPQEQKNDPITGKDNSGNSKNNSSDLEKPDPVDTAKDDPAIKPQEPKDNLTGAAGDSLTAGDDNAVNFPDNASDNETALDKNQLHTEHYNHSGDLFCLSSNSGLGNSDCEMSHGDSILGDNLSNFDLNQHQQQQSSENPDSLF